MSENFYEIYFAKLLPWQQQAWRQLTHQFTSSQLPHGLLASGMAGIGKRSFVWRFVAYALCQKPSDQGACQECSSCHWLKSGTHPDLLVLPLESLPTTQSQTGDKSIKVDDVRMLQEYSQTKGHGAKFIILDHAQTLTVAASNALLKTLEEPREGVFIILITDKPSGLLPTIRSRVQRLPLNQIQSEQAKSYLKEQGVDEKITDMLLQLTDGAVLTAQRLLQTPWFGQRLLWLKTLVALQQKKRTAIAASDYWQSVLNLDDFIHLSRMMLLEVWRVCLDLPCLHTDLPTQQLLSEIFISQNYLNQLHDCLDDIANSRQQNVQEKMAYDRLMVAFANQLDKEN